MLYIWKVTIGHFRHEYFVKQNQILRDALPQIKTYNNFTYDIKTHCHCINIHLRNLKLGQAIHVLY